MQQKRGVLRTGMLVAAMVLVAGVSAPDRASAMTGIAAECYLLTMTEVCEVIEFDICIPVLGEVECTHHRNEIWGERRES